MYELLTLYIMVTAKNSFRISFGIIIKKSMLQERCTMGQNSAILEIKKVIFPFLIMHWIGLYVSSYVSNFHSA